ncbi:50S ribosomal protein L1 [Corynebacterium halotolerans]|uniref:Large ribosomal subunit protein uL1 n=1 Tax=Corynebacterium halotolerans YIM 70093 = DSM 44683 TaxID=1121362 RepID=M1NVH6_9CORY|nr:50S ribosomal protein L1 [Corynebacterium halotolerans]AGF71485.1 50S ribosomal protein L1 [Corynebacterium halotolerans YIM 70093 = DSM 44683]
MSKKSKAFRAAAELVDQNRLYSPIEATSLVKDTSSKNYDATVDVAIRLGVDPRKADQLVRGTVNLPNGTGKTVRVAVFAAGEKATEAEQAGADIVGTDELIEQITAGNINFDVAIATPDQMAKVGRVARVLGPRGLMPNPKTGTVTTDVAKAITEVKGGKISFRVDKASNLHANIGKASFEPKALAENYGALIDELNRIKPSSSKGIYLKKITISSTTGPGIPVDPSVQKNYAGEE